MNYFRAFWSLLEEGTRYLILIFAIEGIPLTIPKDQVVVLNQVIECICHQRIRMVPTLFPSSKFLQ